MSIFAILFSFVFFFLYHSVAPISDKNNITYNSTSLFTNINKRHFLTEYKSCIKRHTPPYFSIIYYITFACIHKCPLVPSFLFYCIFLRHSRARARVVLCPVFRLYRTDRHAPSRRSSDQSFAGIFISSKSNLILA